MISTKGLNLQITRQGFALRILILPLSCSLTPIKTSRIKGLTTERLLKQDFEVKTQPWLRHLSFDRSSRRLAFPLDRNDSRSA